MSILLSTTRMQGQDLPAPSTQGARDMSPVLARGIADGLVADDAVARQRVAA